MTNPTWDDVMVLPVASEAPIIFDIGGYHGDWTAIALAKYPDCHIYVFEPIHEFFLHIINRFAGDSRVTPFNFGLSNFSGQAHMAKKDDESTLCDDGEEVVSIVDVVSFMRDNGITRIDLAKINIEGAEYDLLMRLLGSPEVLQVQNLMVQFHGDAPEVEAELDVVHKGLEKHFSKVFDFGTAFEGWTKKQRSLPPVFCLGDSHISIFSGQDRILSSGETVCFEKFQVHNVGAKLAYAIAGKPEVFEPLSMMSDEQALLVCFGEIDCRAQVGRRCGEGNPDDTIRDVVGHYFDALRIMRLIVPRHKPVLVLSVPPELKEQPHWYYYGSHRKVFDAPQGTLEERRYYKRTFNAMVQAKCSEYGFVFVSLYEWIEKDDGTVDARFYLDDIHLKPSAVKPLIVKAFTDAGVVKEGLSDA